MSVLVGLGYLAWSLQGCATVNKELDTACAYVGRTVVLTDRALQAADVAGVSPYAETYVKPIARVATEAFEWCYEQQ